MSRHRSTPVPLTSLVAVGALALALAGCTTSPEPSPSPTRTPSATPSASPTPVETTIEIVSPAQPTSGSGCVLSLAEEPLAPGVTGLNVSYTDVGSSACTLDGYPTVEFLTASGSPAKVATAEQPVHLFPGERTTLAPGQTGFSFLSISTSGAAPGSCDPGDARTVRVTVADQTPTPLELRIGGNRICGDQDGFTQQIGPFRGSPTTPS